MSGRKHQSADEIPLIPMGDFKKSRQEGAIKHESGIG